MRRYATELIGTFILVFAGTGAVVANEFSNGAVTHVGVAITFGLVVLALVYAIGDISGAHINPAVTIAFWVARRFRGAEVLPYVVSQCVGALLASLCLKFMFPDATTFGETVPVGPWWQSLAMETILTAILMFVIMCVSTGAKEKGIMAGITVGAIILLEAMFAGPVSGASMNPARSFGPAVVSGAWSTFWIYVVAPISGAIVGVGLHRIVAHDEVAPPEP